MELVSVPGPEKCLVPNEEVSTLQSQKYYVLNKIEDGV
jgi:hypothetical protein